jgi:uncharacterized protein
MKEKYFITLHDFSYQEYEVWRLLNKYCNYETNITGYTVNQIVINSNKEANLTTQKVRTILKNFEKQGYIMPLTTGSKGKESTVRLTLKQQLFNNNSTNKNENLQGVEGLPNNNLTTKQQHYKEKKNNNKNNYNLIIEAYTDNINLIEVIKDFIDMRKTIKKPVTDRALKTLLKKLDTITNNDDEKIEVLENSINNCWLSVYEPKNKKAPVNAGTQNKNNFNSSICQSKGSNTEKIKFVNNF